MLQRTRKKLTPSSCSVKGGYYLPIQGSIASYLKITAK